MLHTRYYKKLEYGSWNIMISAYWLGATDPVATESSQSSERLVITCKFAIIPTVCEIGECSKVCDEFITLILKHAKMNRTNGRTDEWMDEQTGGRMIECHEIWAIFAQALNPKRATTCFMWVNRYESRYVMIKLQTRSIFRVETSERRKMPAVSHNSTFSICDTSEKQMRAGQEFVHHHSS